MKISRSTVLRGRQYDPFIHSTNSATVFCPTSTTSITVPRPVINMSGINYSATPTSQHEWYYSATPSDQHEWYYSAMPSDQHEWYYSATPTTPTSQHEWYYSATPTST